MKRLIIARHGEYDHRDMLSSLGKKQIEVLAEKLVQHVDGQSLLILTSTADRASQSAEIIAQRFCVSFEGHDVLWSGGGGKVLGFREDFEAFLKILDERSTNYDVVIVVTHYEYARGFPHFFAHKKFGVELPKSAIDKGTAWLIDCEAKQMAHIA